MSPEIKEAVEVLWNYHRLEQELNLADIIFVLGSNDPRVAAYAAELYQRGLAPQMIFSGGVGRFTDGWQLSEAEIFAKVAQDCGVAADKIFLETQATNTGENVAFSRAILREAGYAENLRVIALQKPYMERRTLATLEMQWAEAQLQVSSFVCSFDEYISEDLPADFVIQAMVGDFQRILEYPAQGFSTPQPVTEEVLAAFRTLVEAGYDSQLLKGIALPWE